MDREEYSSLAAALSAVPDPRHARGRRHGWGLILTLIGAAMVSGQRGVRAIGQWVDERAAELGLLLSPAGGRLPSVSTLRRALRAVDAAALEDRVAAFVQALPASSGGGACGLALDGKAVRGANRHGAQVHLVSLVRHGSGQVLGQVQVAAKGNEIAAAPALLAGRDLTGTVVTMDALLTQRALAAQIRAQGGHYLMVVKENQPALHAAIHALFSEPPPALPTDYLATATSTERGHGRRTTRTLDRSAALNDYLDWPAVGQVLRRTYHAIDLATGQVRHEVTYGVSSLPARTTSAAQMAGLWRAHWSIENRVHYVRDVTLGEDAGQAWVGSTPQALAALRNALLSLLRATGWTNIADALRHYGAYPRRALSLLGALPLRL
jgi:predicted transposase YbfD/YdcC